MHYVIAYDIVQSRRRRKVMNALKDNGLPVQYSVFDCELEPARLEMVKALLLKLIDRKSDRVDVFPLCEACYFRGERLGRPY